MLHNHKLAVDSVQLNFAMGGGKNKKKKGSGGGGGGQKAGGGGKKQKAAEPAPDFDPMNPPEAEEDEAGGEDLVEDDGGVGEASEKMGGLEVGGGSDSGNDMSAQASASSVDTPGT